MVKQKNNLYHQWIIETFFSLEYAGELRIIVLKGEEESYIDSHTDTLKTHTETHTSTHAQGKQKNTGPPPVQSTRDTIET